MDQLRLFVDLVLHNRYKITRQLGCGGMGAVYEATDLKEKRQVAIKQMLPGDPNLRLAFQREADILSQITHPGLPHAIDYFENENGLFMAMEFIPGENLGQLLTARGLPFAPHQVKHWAEELLQILSFLHTQTPRIIHRDIKPTNLKLTPQGRIILLDFGLSKTINEDNKVITNICILAYTPNYAPLEQIQGESTNDYSDIYALGATLYHLLTGTPPTDSLKRANNILCQKGDPLPQLAHLVQGVPQSLSSLVMKALSLRPSDRPTSASQMLQQLQANIIAPAFRSTTPTFTEPATSIPIPAKLEATYGLPAFNETTLVRNPVQPAAQQSKHPHLSAVPSSQNQTEPTLKRNQFSVHFPQPSIQIVPTPTSDRKNHQPARSNELHHLRLTNAQLQTTNHDLIKYAKTASNIVLIIGVALISTFFYHSEINPLRTTFDYDPYTTHKTVTLYTTPPTLQPARNKRLPRPLQSQPVFINESDIEMESITIDDLIRQKLLRQELKRLRNQYRQHKPITDRNRSTSL